MRFVYVYRTSDNVVHEGDIIASSRDDVYEKLKLRRVKPYNVRLAPGLFNHLASIGKSGLAIVLLSVAVAVAILVIHHDRNTIQTIQAQPSYLPRHQIPGLPKNWYAEFKKSGVTDADLFFAKFAQPGVDAFMNVEREGSTRLESLEAGAVAFGDGLESPLVVGLDDPSWMKELKQIVLGMKRDACFQRMAGKSDAELLLWLSERQRMEMEYRTRIVGQYMSGGVSKEEANKMFAAMGLEPLK